MKRLGIGIAVILVLALLLFQRKEEAAAEKAQAASSQSPSLQRAETVSSAGGKPTKVRQRPEPQPKVAKTPVAKPVKGRPGFVHDPSDGRILDVRGVPAGTMVSNGTGAIFVVPKMGYIITPEAAMKAFTPREGGVMIVSCTPIFPDARWDDGTPVAPGDAPGRGEGF